MYWKGKVAFYSVPNQIFNHATSQSALINTLMPSSLHCPLGRESSKDTIAMGMCDSYTLNPPLCMDYILPVSSPDVRNPYSFVVVCGNCVVKEVSCCPMRGSTTSTTVPLSSLWRKVCWKEGNPLLQIQRCTPVPALWRTNHWRVDLGIIRGTSVLPVSLSPINHITPRNLTRGWMMKSFWNIQRRDYS